MDMSHYVSNLALLVSRQIMKTIKVLIIGEGSVGKTSFLYRKFLQEEIYTNPTTGFNVENIKVNNTIIQCLDLGGGCKIRTLIPHYLHDTNVILCVYSVDYRYSFDVLYEEFLVNCINKNPETKMILVGNKCDMETSRQVSYNEGLEFAKSHNMLFFETSVKNNKNIDSVFTWISHFG